MDQTPQHLLHEAGITCDQLAELIATENAALEARDIQAIADGLKRKTKLAYQLEKTLHGIKTNKDAVLADARSAEQIRRLQQEMDHFQAISRKNMLMLKAAHQTRADFLMLVRDTLEQQRPKPDTYNQTGSMNAPTDTGTTLVKRSV